MPQNKVLCKYFLQGACLKGDACQFSHSFDDPSNNVCTFYQRGCCSYGSRCRYEHVKLARQQLPYEQPPYIPPPGPAPQSQVASGSEFDISPNFAGMTLEEHQPMPFLNAWQAPYTPPPYTSAGAYATQPAYILPHPWEEYEEEEEQQQQHVEAAIPTEPADIPICSYGAAGYCPYGVKCTRLHGDLCESCNKQCLHPHRPEEREIHKKKCERNQKRLELLRMSQDIECSVCLERVLSKPTVSERKFGLLSGCDHPFCISCIRDWRGGAHPGMDLDTVVRACPVCRIASHYVIPSVMWYTTPEEKQDIVTGYKEKLSSIDCKHFNFGNATCPFGTSCFYRHAFSDGTKAEVKLRHLGAADGTTVIAKNIRLSDFISLRR